MKKKQTEPVSENAKSFYWVTTTYQSHFEDLRIKSGSLQPSNANNGLYYPNTDEGKKAAEGMLKAIKQAIYDFNKTQKYVQSWITEEWLNKPIQ